MKSVKMCFECKRMFYLKDMCLRGGRCKYCETSRPADLVVDIGNYHAEVHSNLMSKKQLSHFLSVCNRYSKEISERGDT